MKRKDVNRLDNQEIRDDGSLQALLVDSGPLARGKLLEAMEPHIIAQCNSVMVNSTHDREDLYMDCMVSVIEAMDLYDYRYGAAFATFATWRMKAATSRWLASNSGTLPMPHEAFRVAHLVDKKEDELGRPLTIAEMQEFTGKGYIFRAIQARRQYVTMDMIPEAMDLREGGIEDVPLDEVVLGFLKENPSDYAVEEFCEEHELSSTVYENMMEVVNENRNRPGTNKRGGVANRKRGSTQSRNRRR